MQTITEIINGQEFYAILGTDLEGKDMCVIYDHDDGEIIEVLRGPVEVLKAHALAIVHEVIRC